MGARPLTWRALLEREATDCLEKILAEGENNEPSASEIPAAARASGSNLLHYLAFERSCSPRLRARLWDGGLALSDEPLSVVRDLAGISGGFPRALPPGKRLLHLSRQDAGRILSRRAATLLGPRRGRCRTRVMVTAPEQSADDRILIRELLRAGVSVLRINCARGDPHHWKRIAAGLRKAERETGLRCRLFVDLAGPKARTVDVVSLCRGDDSPRVKIGQSILLRGRIAKSAGSDRSVVVQATVSIPEILGRLTKGQRVWIDDATIGGIVVDTGSGWVKVRIDQVRGKGRRLRTERSINMPEAEGGAAEWTGRDREDLQVVASLADMVGLSFVTSTAQVREAREMLAQAGSKSRLVVKVENATAVRILPELLLEALRGGTAGVLIARGDLAAECGFDALADLQRRITSMAHAAHLPVILATQVLERMVRDGIPTRAEIIDLAFARGIECCMLNKGDHLPQAVALLRSVLQ